MHVFHKILTKMNEHWDIANFFISNSLTKQLCITLSINLYQNVATFAFRMTSVLTNIFLMYQHVSVSRVSFNSIVFTWLPEHMLESDI